MVPDGRVSPNPEGKFVSCVIERRFPFRDTILVAEMSKLIIVLVRSSKIDGTYRLGVRYGVWIVYS